MAHSEIYTLCSPLSLHLSLQTCREVSLSRGGGVALDLASFAGAVGVMSGSDRDGDCATDIWARTGGGASTTVVSPFSVEGCDLAQVTFSTGEPAELPVGGSVGTASGVECTDDGQLLAFTASYTGDGTTETYQVTTVAYRLEDGDRKSTRLNSSP